MRASWLVRMTLADIWGPAMAGTEAGDGEPAEREGQVAAEPDAVGLDRGRHDPVRVLQMLAPTSPMALPQSL